MYSAAETIGRGYRQHITILNAHVSISVHVTD